MWKKYSPLTSNNNKTSSIPFTQNNKYIAQSLNVSRNNSHKSSSKKLNDISWKVENRSKSSFMECKYDVSGSYQNKIQNKSCCLD
jgi:hypothetical protein